MDKELSRLVQKATTGDGDAIARLCEQKAKDVLYICIKLTGSQQDGQDAAQEVLLAMMLGLPRLRDPQTFQAWLNRIIGRVCARMRLRSKRSIGHLPLDEARLEDRVEFLPPEFAEEQETRQTVLACFQQLPPKQQHILLQFYFEEMSLAEIALAMNTSPGAARTTLYRARNALKKRVEKAQGAPLGRVQQALVPTLQLILQSDAATLASEEGVQGVLLALGAGTAAATTAAAAAAAGTAGVAGATLVPAVALGVCGILLGGGIYLSSSSTLPVEFSVSVPQPVQQETQQQDWQEHNTEQQENGTILESDSSVLLSPSIPSRPGVYTTSQSPVSSNVEDTSRPAPAVPPQTAQGEITGRILFVDREGSPQTHEWIDLSLYAVQALRAGQVVGQASICPDGAFQLELPLGDAPLLRLVQPAGSGLVGTGDVYAGIGQEDVRLCVTDTEAPLAGIRFYGPDGEIQPHNRAPVAAQVLHMDASPATVEWQLLQGGVQLAAGQEGDIPLEDLLPASGQRELVLLVTVRDLAGNTTTLERNVYRY